MKIHVPSIPEEGKSIVLHPGLAWVKALVAERFQEFCAPESKMSGDVLLLRTHTNVTLQGKVRLEIQPKCDRCGKVFARELEVPLHRHLAPYFGNPDERREAGEDEVELDGEDMEFSCYHHDEIDLAEIIAEEVLLALPMGFHCREDCKGLCPRCGGDLNRAPCACPTPETASPFSTLKSLKFPSEGR